MNSFERLEVEIKGLKSRVDSPGVVAFLVEECMRFYSIAGSLTATFDLKNDSAEERYLTHILGRSLLEGFFWVLYIFDKEGETNSRYEEKLGAFRREYGKLHTEDPPPSS